MSATRKFERIVVVSPAFDKRHADPSKNYGIHGAEIMFVLKGERGATFFTVFTNWHLPHVSRELWRKRGGSEYNPFEPMGADVGFHSPFPQWEGQESRTDECEYLDGKPCYSDSSASAGEPMMTLLIEKGGDAMWAELESWYDDRFPEKASVESLNPSQGTQEI